MSNLPDSFRCHPQDAQLGMVGEESAEELESVVRTLIDPLERLSTSLLEQLRHHLWSAFYASFLEHPQARTIG